MCYPGFYTPTDDAYIVCNELESSGRSCNSATNCRSGSCRGGRCCALGMSNATNTLCTSCGSNGECNRCIEHYTVVGDECLRSCRATDSTTVAHGGYESRTMYSGLPTDGQRCSDLDQMQARQCTNGTWSSWSGGPPPALPAAMFSLPSCTDRCPMVPEAGMRLCLPTDNETTDEALMLNFSACEVYTGASIPSEATAITVRYPQAEVPVGSVCVPQILMRTCISTGVVTSGNVTSADVPYGLCRPRCASNCSLTMEFNESVCHDECNNLQCAFQHGNCARLLMDDQITAEAAVQRSTPSAASSVTFADICARRVVGDPIQDELRESACVVASASVLNGADSSFIFPLYISEYLERMNDKIQVRLRG
jgi:hypothetical protein